jgi:glycosyltransferase involved in cell wall biosynthesis
VSRPVTVGLVVSSPDWRGSVTSFAKVADGLREAGHRAFFVTAHAALTAALRERGYEAEELGALRTGLRELRGMRAILKRRGATAVYADMPRDLRLAALAGRTLGAGAAYRFNVNAGRMKGDPLSRLAFHFTGAVVILSEWSRGRMQEAGPWVARRPILRIPNGFESERWTRDPDAAARVRDRLGIGAGVPLVLCASVFAALKRQEFVIAALEQWPGEGARPVLLLAGGEEAEAPFRERARSSSVEVRFIGRPGSGQMRELYSAADVVAQPAMNESFGNVIGEAMCCEAAVVVPDAGAAPETVGPAAEGAGVILPATEVEAWGREIAALVADPARRAALGRKGRARIVREFPVARMQQAHTELFERLSR